MSRAAIEEGFYGIAFAPSGRELFASGAGQERVLAWDFVDGLCSRPRHFPLRQEKERGVPAGLAVAPDGRTLYVANVFGHLVNEVHLTDSGVTPREFLLGPRSAAPPVGDQDPWRDLDDEAITKRARALLEVLNSDAPYPYGCALDPARGRLYVSLWGLYIIKENRTYDQILGDLPQGNGDPALCLFPEKVTPNHHQIAREFVLFDNFHAESEVSADGHEWSMAAYASDYVEKIWLLSYGHNRGRKYAYPSEGRFRIAEPAGGYLWDRARAAGVSYRSYGEFINNGASTNEPCFTLVPSLRDHFDPWFRSFDMDYSDLARADRFISELHRFEAEGEMPRLQILRLPNDHTAGTTPGKPTPTAYVVENDLAFGRVVEAITHSRFWPQTAVFVVEDDAQDGPDHVDAHRTIAYAISPYVRRGTVDSTLYSTASMLRTIELILGLRPMSQFDAAAMPMLAAFGAKPDSRPYEGRPATVDLSSKNTPQAWGGHVSAGMNFTREDAIDDALLNQIIWRSVRGEGSPTPPPRLAAYARKSPVRDDD